MSEGKRSIPDEKFSPLSRRALVQAPALQKAGHKLLDPGRYQLMNNDFNSQISAFKAAAAEIVTGNMIPPDFATFWSRKRRSRVSARS
jgi:branched-chain amino acid transport system substrate-binding protein